MNRDVVGVTLSTALAVLGEVAVSVSASSIPLPKNYSLFVSLAAFAIAVSVVVISRSERDDKPRTVGKARSRSLRAGGEKPQVVRGKSLDGSYSDSDLVAGSILIWAGYLMLLAGAVIQIAEWTNQVIRISVFVLAVIVVLVGYAARVDSRAALTFTSEGIIVKDAHHRNTLLRWDQAVNFRTVNRWFKDYLVAEPAPGSDYYEDYSKPCILDDPQASGLRRRWMYAAF